MQPLAMWSLSDYQFQTPVKPLLAWKYQYPKDSPSSLTQNTCYCLPLAEFKLRQEYLLSWVILVGLTQSGKTYAEG